MHGTSLVDPFQDPLHVRPAALDTGVALPGDSAPPACPMDDRHGTDAEHPLTLDRAVDLALCRSPQVRAAWAAIKVQAATLGEARAAYWPTLNASVARQHTQTRYPDSPGASTSASGHTGYLSTSWRLLDFGTRAAQREAAGQSLVAALASHDAALQKTLSSVIGAYFDALAAEGGMRARDQASQLAQSTLEATRRREQRGVAPMSDALQAGTALAKARLAQQRATGDYRKALSVLTYAIGLAPASLAAAPIRLVDNELAEPADGSELQAREAMNELAQWMAQAQARHPAIAAARAQLAASEARVAAARAEGLPTLDLTGNFYQNGYPNQGLQLNRSQVTTVGVVLSIPLFEGFARTYKIRGAQAQTEQSEAQLADTRNQVLMEVVKAHADAVSALGNLESSQTLMNAAQASVASSQRRYAGGAADILELLATQSTLADAQQERVRCLAEWRSARLRLVASAGALGRQAVLKR
nr:TolC family protein [Variovorax terrae]